MAAVIQFFEKILPYIVSLASVIVAGVAVTANKKLAYRQAFFDRKSHAYEMFYAALADLAYDQHNPQKRAALTNAVYCALLFSPQEAAKGLNFVAEWALKSENRTDFSALDAVLPKLRDILSLDLSRTWTKPIEDMHEDLTSEKKESSKGG